MTLKILFLDDMEERHVKARQKFIGHDLTAVYNAAAAITAMTQQRFDVVCLDHDLAPEHYQEHLTGRAVTLQGSGTEVADFMANTLPTDFRPGQVILHSLNGYARNRMETILVNAQYPQVEQRPFTAW